MSSLTKAGIDHYTKSNVGAVNNGVITAQIPVGNANAEEGYDVTKLIMWLSECERSIPETMWRVNAMEDYRFYAGKQDTPEVISELQAQRRPQSTFNEILPKVNMLNGLAAQTKHAPNVIPVGGQEDEPVAEILNDVLAYLRKKTKMTRKELDCFSHTVKSGRSLLYFFVDDQNPFKPEIKCQRIPGYNFVIDPNFKEYDLSDARYMFISKWLSEEDIKSKWDVDIYQLQQFGSNYTAGYGAGIGSSIPLFFNEFRHLYRIIECWYYMYETVIWFINPLTGESECLSPKDFKMFEQALREGFNVQGKMIKLPEGQKISSSPGYKKQYYYKIFSGLQVKEGGRSPYKFDGFPVAFYGGYNDEDDNTWFGLIKQLKDPQRAKNTMKRQLSHLLQVLPKGILAHESGAILNIDEYEKRSADPTFHLEVSPGMMERFKFIQQPTISPIYAQYDASMSESMKDISGIQNELMGQETSSRTPGVTVQARQETSLSVLFTLFDNFQESRINGDKITLSMIQQYMTDAQVLRIMGTEGKKLIEVNTQLNPQIQGYNDITVGEYDVTISEVIETASQQQTIMGVLSDYAGQNPGTIPPDVILEYANAPYSVKQKIREYGAQKAEAAQAEADRTYELELLKIGVKAQDDVSTQELNRKELEVKEREVAANKAAKSNKKE